MTYFVVFHMILTEGEFFPTGADAAAILVAPLPIKIGWRTVAAARATVYPGPQLSLSNVQVSVRMAHHTVLVSRRCLF
jgi:hypothetical protein